MKVYNMNGILALVGLYLYKRMCVIDLGWDSMAIGRTEVLSEQCMLVLDFRLNTIDYLAILSH